MLKLRQMIPPIAVRATDGHTLRSDDFKQKRSLLLAFLHSDCAACEQYLARLATRAAELAERDATALVIFSAPPPLSLANLPREVMVAADVSGHSQRAFLGDEAFGTARRPGSAGVGVFVTDRYGELCAQWHGPTDDALPSVGDALSCLAQAQTTCGE